MYYIIRKVFFSNIKEVWNRVEIETKMLGVMPQLCYKLINGIFSGRGGGGGGRKKKL